MRGGVIECSNWFLNSGWPQTGYDTLSFEPKREDLIFSTMRMVHFYSGIPLKKIWKELKWSLAHKNKQIAQPIILTIILTYQIA